MMTINLRFFIPKILNFLCLLCFISCKSINSQTTLLNIAKPTESQTNPPNSQTHNTLTNNSSAQSSAIGAFSFEEKPILPNWSQFLIPKIQNSVLSPVDFIFSAGSYEYISHEPQLKLGKCSFLNQKTISRIVFEAAPTLKFKLPSENSKYSSGSIYFVNDKVTNKSLAIGVFDSNGFSECHFDQKTMALSTGMGLLRQDSVYNTQLQNLDVTAAPFGRLTVNPDFKKGIAPGQILRIGRFESAHKTLSESLYHMNHSDRINSELFVKSANPSENLGLAEYLKTSILISETAFSVNLEAGKYIAFVTSSHFNDWCTIAFEIVGNQTQNLECQKSSESKNKDEINSDLISKQQNTFSNNYDVTILPTSFLKDESFSHWLQFWNKSNFVAPQFPTDHFKNLPPAMPLDFSEFYPKIKKYGALFTSLKPELFSANTQLDAVRIFDSKFYVGPNLRVEEFYRKNDNKIFPLMGTSESSIQNDIVPFLTQSRFIFHPDAEKSIQSAIQYSTNGTAIEWLEPLLTYETSLPLRMPLQQRFRFRIKIPAWNATQYVDLYINGEFFKRWILNRGDISLAMSEDIEERIDRKADFDLGLFAWGNAFLPEFIYGSAQLTPIALTRQYCVDANENGLCEVLK